MIDAEKQFSELKLMICPSAKIGHEHLAAQKSTGLSKKYMENSNHMTVISPGFINYPAVE